MIIDVTVIPNLIFIYNCFSETAIYIWFLKKNNRLFFFYYLSYYFLFHNFPHNYYGFFPSFFSYNKSKTNLGDFWETPETPWHSRWPLDNPFTILDDPLVILGGYWADLGRFKGGTGRIFGGSTRDLGSGWASTKEVCLQA